MDEFGREKYKCKVCGAHWYKHQDNTWQLCSPSAGPCCDNVPMGDQMVELEDDR